MGAAIALNIAIIVLFVIFGAAFGSRDYETGWGAWFGFALAFGLSVTFWIIFVAAHFIGKYW